VNFYDRRLDCPAAGTDEAASAGLALDISNPNFSGSLPPYGATNYCVDTSIEFYGSSLNPLGHNIRLSQHSWDPQLNAPRRFCVCSANATFIRRLLWQFLRRHHQRLDLGEHVQRWDEPRSLPATGGRHRRDALSVIHERAGETPALRRHE